MHVDEFVDFNHQDEAKQYAAFCLFLFRLPAALRITFRKWIHGFHLFCTYKGNRYRVTGASTLGDVWLANDFNRETGYDHRVDVDECTDWKNEP
jgi:hypothetical protein